MDFLVIRINADTQRYEKTAESEGRWNDITVSAFSIKKWTKFDTQKTKTLTEVSAEVSLELQSNTQKQHAQSDMSMFDP